MLSRRDALTIGQVLVALTLLDQFATAHDYAVGADVSFLKQAEDRGVQFKDDGEVKPGLEILRNHGFGWVRLRLFVQPDRLPNDLEYTMALAKDAKELGFKFLLNYHYSDTWADPGKQYTPAAWMELTHEQRVVKVREYTRETIAAFREAGAMPDMVQIGNEIRPGMLWPDGRIPENWDNFAEYFKAGIEGVKEGRGDEAMPRIMLHYDQGANKRGLKSFFDKFRSYDIPIDVIGVSYYPWWHGSLLDLREGLNFVATAYDIDVIVVETAYHWRENGETRDVAPMPFPETPEGQKAFLQAVHEIVLAVPGGHGKGVFWWEPAVGGRGGIGSRGCFDADNNALPALTTFDAWALPLRRRD